MGLTACHPSEVSKMSTSVAAKEAAHEGIGYQRIDQMWYWCGAGMMVRMASSCALIPCEPL